MLGKVEMRQTNRPRDGRHCDLCGCSQPAVRCDKCGCQVFCLSCDDMYHRHPKRRFHLRKAVDPAPHSPQARPVLPVKASHLNTAPGDPSKMPLPPPRKKKPGKSFFDSFRRGSPSSDNSPPLPKKEYSWTDRLGSIKKFMSNRPLPPLPTGGEQMEIDPPATNGQANGRDLSFIHKRVDEKPPQLPERSPKTQEFPGQAQNRDGPQRGPFQGEVRNGSMEPSHMNQNTVEQQWNNTMQPQVMNQQHFGTLNRHGPQGFMPQVGPGYPPSGMHQSASATDLHNLDAIPQPPGMPPYPAYPMQPHMHYPYPMYPQYPGYFGNSFANLSHPPTSTDGDFSDHSEASLPHHPSGKRQPFRKRAKRSQSVMVDRMAYPGQFFPFGPFHPGYGPPPPWGAPPMPMEPPPSPGGSVRSLHRRGRRKKVTSEEDEEFSMSSSPLSRPKSSSSDRPPRGPRKAPLATQTTSSEEESEEEETSNRNKSEKLPRRDSDPRRTTSPLVIKSPPLEDRRTQKQKKKDTLKHSEPEDQDTGQTRQADQDAGRNDRRSSKDSNADSSEPTRPVMAHSTAKDWQCKHCTYINPMGNRICQVCCKTSSPPDSRPPSGGAAGSRKQSLGSEQGRSSPEKKVEDDEDPQSKQNKQDMAILNSALDEAEKEISRGLEELMKLKEDITVDTPAEEKDKDSRGQTSGNTGKPVYKSTGKMRTSILEKLNLNKQATTTTSTSTSTDMGTDTRQDKILRARKMSNSSSASETFNSPIAQSPDLRRSSTDVNRSKKDFSCQTLQDNLFEYLERKKAEEEAIMGRMGGNFGLGYADRFDAVTSPVPSMYDRFLGAGFGPMQRSHSRASLFTGRLNDLGPSEYNGPGLGCGPSPMYRSASRSSLTGDFGDARLSEFQHLRKPDFYLSMEELVERRRQENLRAQGLELVRMIREAEQQGFTADDIQVALSNCGQQSPVEWLTENWRQTVDSVVSLATRYGEGKGHNDVGAVSETEARGALRLHKGNVWAAVTECVEGRQRKFLELSARGKFDRKNIVDALTSSKGDVEMAYAKLTKSTGKPFLMRIWGAGEGVQNQDGAIPMDDNFRPMGAHSPFRKDELLYLSDEHWTEDEDDVEWDDEDEEEGDADDLQTCHESLIPQDLKTPESDKSDYCDAFPTDDKRSVSSDDIFFVIPDTQQTKKKGAGLLSKLAALRKDSKDTGLRLSNDGDTPVTSREDQRAATEESSSISGHFKSFGPLSMIKNTISAIKDTVIGTGEKKLPCTAPERRTIIVRGQVTHESLDNSDQPVKLTYVKPIEDIIPVAKESDTIPDKPIKDTTSVASIKDKECEKPKISVQPASMITPAKLTDDVDYSKPTAKYSATKLTEDVKSLQISAAMKSEKAQTAAPVDETGQEKSYVKQTENLSSNENIVEKDKINVKAAEFKNTNNADKSEIFSVTAKSETLNFREGKGSGNVKEGLLPSKLDTGPKVNTNPNNSIAGGAQNLAKESSIRHLLKDHLDQTAKVSNVSVEDENMSQNQQKQDATGKEILLKMETINQTNIGKGSFLSNKSSIDLVANAREQPVYDKNKATGSNVAFQHALEDTTSTVDTKQKSPTIALKSGESVKSSHEKDLDKKVIRQEVSSLHPVDIHNDDVKDKSLEDISNQKEEITEKERKKGPALSVTESNDSSYEATKSASHKSARDGPQNVETNVQRYPVNSKRYNHVIAEELNTSVSVENNKGSQILPLNNKNDSRDSENLLMGTKNKVTVSESLGSFADNNVRSSDSVLLNKESGKVVNEIPMRKANGVKCSEINSPNSESDVKSSKTTEEEDHFQSADESDNLPEKIIEYGNTEILTPAAKKDNSEAAFNENSHLETSKISDEIMETGGNNGSLVTHGTPNTENILSEMSLENQSKSASNEMGINETPEIQNIDSNLNSENVVNETGPDIAANDSIPKYSKQTESPSEFPHAINKGNAISSSEHGAASTSSYSLEEIASLTEKVSDIEDSPREPFRSGNELSAKSNAAEGTKGKMHVHAADLSTQCPEKQNTHSPDNQTIQSSNNQNSHSFGNQNIQSLSNINLALHSGHNSPEQPSASKQQESNELSPEPVASKGISKIFPGSKMLKRNVAAPKFTKQTNISADSNSISKTTFRSNSADPESVNVSKVTDEIRGNESGGMQSKTKKSDGVVLSTELSNVKENADNTTKRRDALPTEGVSLEQSTEAPQASTSSTTDTKAAIEQLDNANAKVSENSQQRALEHKNKVNQSSDLGTTHAELPSEASAEVVEIENERHSSAESTSKVSPGRSDLQTITDTSDSDRVQRVSESKIAADATHGDKSVAQEDNEESSRESRTSNISSSSASLRKGEDSHISGRDQGNSTSANSNETPQHNESEEDDDDDDDDESFIESRPSSITPPSPVDALRSRFEGLMGIQSTSHVTAVRPQSPFRRMSFNSTKQAIALEREKDSSLDRKAMNQQKVSKEPFKTLYQKRSIKQQLEMERKVRRLVADRKCPTYRKAEIVVQLIDMEFNEEEALQAAGECSTLEQAVSYLRQECLLCAGHFAVSEIVSMIHCPHKACRQCIRAYFTVQIRDRTIMELQCPFCNEPDITDDDVAQDYFNNLDIMLKKLVEPEIHELFQRKLRDRVLMKDPNFRWCSQCCSGFIAMPNLKRLVCPDCNAVTCASCRRPWEAEHQGITCEAFAAWKDATDPEAQTAGLAKLLTEDGIDCPNCHFRYALAKGGCMHFRCIQCQHDFCSGCSRPFRMGQKCGVSEFCAKLGLHAHHPRNCLFYLRDKEPVDLERLLEMSGVEYNTEAPDEEDDTCQVMEQKETKEGMVDDHCGKPVEEGFAGLCRVHYVEYLGQLVNKYKVDPIQIFDNDDLELVLRRANIRLPPKRYRESDVQYREKLVKLIQEELPLDRMDGS